MAAADQNVLDGRRAFPRAQELFAGRPSGPWQQVMVGWHDTTTDPESGAFALVADGSGLDDWIGRIIVVRVSQDRQVLVYVLDSSPDLIAPVVVSLARRAYAGLMRLSRSPIACDAAVVR